LPGIFLDASGITIDPSASKSAAFVAWYVENETLIHRRELKKRRKNVPVTRRCGIIPIIRLL
jgi:hypothetical protein